MARRRKPLDLLGATPVHPDRDHPLVVYGDHRFCVGRKTEVRRMEAPHMHSQIELNLLLEGSMTYWFDGDTITLVAGRLGFFWGMLPHQVTAVRQPTHFVCLYMPMAVFLALPLAGPLRHAVFRGAFVEAPDLPAYERDVFLRWHRDLIAGDDVLEQIVRDEVCARMRRIDRDGWRDLRAAPAAGGETARHNGHRVEHVERMMRFIAEHALDGISAGEVGRHVGLNANYAMELFKRNVGMTITQSITRHRLDTAQSLLIGTDMPITTIAFEAGFGSLSRFHEAFRLRFGIRPGDFRRQLQRGRTPLAQDAMTAD